MMSTRIVVGLLALVLVLGACGDDDEDQENMPNTASVYCVEQGGTLDIRSDAEGNQYGVCVFTDGSECDEWAYYHGECAPGEDAAGLPNPASAYCEEQGGTVEIRSDAEGNQYGFCVFADGSECDEWAYYRGECSPGGSLGGEGAGIANPASVFCIEQGGTLDIRTDAEGNQYGFCVFADGSECDEWAFFRGECSPGG
jgi:putative hemolysin